AQHGLDDPRGRRRHLRDDQRHRRLPHHRSHAPHVPQTRRRLEGPACEERGALMSSTTQQVSYLIASILFILPLRGLSSPGSARRGILLAEIGMLIAIVGTLLHHEIVSYTWIAVAMAAGSVIGVAISAWIPMTKMPERIAFSHAFGGLAAALVGVS